MRILLTADPEIPVPPVGYGGIERIVDALLRHFRSAGHEVALVAHPDSLSPAAWFFPWPGLSSGGRLDALRNMLALRRAVRTFCPDVVHSFSRLAYLALLFRDHIPLLMSYQRHTGGSGITRASRLAGDRLRFAGCSEFICQMGRRAGGTWQAIPNFVEPERFTFVAHVPADAPLVFLSRIESIKGPDLAIAVARAAGRRLTLAGNHATSGPERAFWDSKIAPEIGHDGVEWIGEVNDSQKNRLLGSAAALLVPIQWDEPFGIVFAEALACGTPVITCRRGATSEIVDEDCTGSFIRNLDDGVAAVRRISEFDRLACRRAAESRFSADVCTTRYLGLYAHLIASVQGIRHLPSASNRPRL